MSNIVTIVHIKKGINRDQKNGDLGHPVFTLCHEQYILSFLYQELVMQELVAQETIKMF